MTSCEGLAAAAAAGDREAMRELVKLLQAPVWRFAYSLTQCRDLADEAAQETWTRAIRGMGSFRAESEFLTWVLAIERRVVARMLDTRSVSTTLPEVETGEDTGSIGLAEVKMELARLPRDLREALILTQVLGLSYAETAEVMGVKLGTVRSRVYRARAGLTSALERRTEEKTDEM